jgi:DNA-binding MarR family transcriptional regulator
VEEHRLDHRVDAMAADLLGAVVGQQPHEQSANGWNQDDPGVEVLRRGRDLSEGPARVEGQVGDERDAAKEDEGDPAHKGAQNRGESAQTHKPARGESGLDGIGRRRSRSLGFIHGGYLTISYYDIIQVWRCLRPVPWSPRGITAQADSSLSEHDYAALASFRYALRRFLQFSAEAAKAVGLSPQQHQALLAIRGAEAPEQVTVGFLAERLQLKHHSAVGLVDRLAKRGLVRRRPDPADRRLVHLGLTALGERLVAKLSTAHRAELRKWAPELQERLRTIAGA